MSLLDWIEVHNEKEHVHLIPEMKGSFNVTIGDAVNGIYGARHTHIYGGEIKLVCDPEDLLAGKLAHAIPFVAEALIGIGGNATFVYAQNTSATYGGPKIDIRRAQSVSKQSDNVIPRLAGAAAVAGAAAGAHGAAAADPIDKATCRAVAALSTLVVAVPAVFELLMRFKYSGTQGQLPSILKLCAVGITSRLMDFLKKLEECGTWAGLAAFYSHFGAYIGTKLSAFLEACVDLGARLGEWLYEDAEDALEDAAEAVVHVAEAVEDDAAALV